MSNFQELQAYKLDWKLNHDESLFEKMDYLQDNVLACSHLVHNSISELNRAINASGTTLSNAINAFNQLNHTKFLENVVEDMHDAEQKREVMHQERQQEILSESVHLISVNGEKEKIQFALELAIHEVSKKRKAAEAGEEDADNLDESRASIDRRKENKKKGYAGTSSLLKLPFVINTPEFKKHLFAGVVFLNTDVEQVELFQEEQQAKIEDKKMETKVLQENAQAIVQVERAIEQAVQMNVANIPAPPPGDLGNIPPPPGFGVAYVPALVAGGVIKKPEATLPVAQVQQQNNGQQENQGRTEQNSGGMAQQLQPAEQASANDQYASNPLFSGGWRRPTEKAQQSSLFDIPAPTQQMPTGPKVDIYAMMSNANKTSLGLFGLEAIGGESSGPVKTADNPFDDEEDDFQQELVKPKSAEAVIAKATAPPQKPKPKGMWDVEEEDEDFGKKAKPVAKTTVKSNLLDSDDEEEDFKPTVKTVASKTVATKKVSVLDSDSDDKPVVKAAPQKKMAVLDSDDDDVPPPKKAPVVALKKNLLDSDDSDEPAPVKQPVAALKKTQSAGKKNFLDSDDEEEDFKPPAKVTPTPAKAPPSKATPAKAKQELFGDSDESDGFKPPAKPQAPETKLAPTRAATTVEKKKNLLDSDDEDDVKPQAPAKPVTAPQAAPPKSAIKKPVVVSDDDDDFLAKAVSAPAKLINAPQAAPPQSAPQAAPPKSAIKKPVVVSDDDDDFQAKPARTTVKFQEPPKQAPEPPIKDESSPPRQSIAQLAAKINLAALDPSKNPNLAANKEAERRTIVQSKPLTTANRSSSNLDHANFAFKPLLKKRTAAAKKMEFVDSEEESAPVVHAQAQNFDQNYNNDQYNQQNLYSQYDHQQYDQNQYYDYNQQQHQQQHQEYDPTEYQAHQKDPSMPKQPRPSQSSKQRPQVVEEVAKQQQPASKKQMFKDSDEEEVKSKAVIAPVAEVKKPLPTFDADSDDEPAPQAKAQKPSAAMLVMQTKQPVPAAKKKVASKFANSDDDDSSEEDKPYNPPPTKSQAEQIAQSNPRSTATTVKKVADFSDDEDEDFAFKPKTAVQPKAVTQTKPPVQAAKKKMLFESDDD